MYEEIDARIIKETPDKPGTPLSCLPAALTNTGIGVSGALTLFKEKYTLWIDEEYVLFRVNGLPDLCCVFVTREHIKKEEQRIDRLLRKNNLKFEELLQLSNIKSQFKEAKAAMGSMKDYYVFRTYAGGGKDGDLCGDYAKGSSYDSVNGNSEDMLLTLCPHCVGQFYNIPGNTVRRTDKNQKIKETCMYCNYRDGYDYVISKKH
ncbi:MAG: hypothetical protein LBB94_10775 [Clostridiales bacterium]|jgi:hypothetical protein|nr:hypothetical protein [Clostridiales bacterium]